MKRVSEVYTSEYTQYDFSPMLLPELWKRIFSVVLPSLQEIAQVSTKWRDIAYDPAFYKAIVPSQRFGSEDWEKYIGTVEKETCLPYCLFKDIARGEGYLTWVPPKVNNIILDSCKKLEMIVQNPKEGHKSGFHENSWSDIMKAPRTPQKPHWVWIEKKTIHRKCEFKYDLQKLAHTESQKEGTTNGADISSFTDTLITFFMEKIRSNINCFENQSKGDGHEIWMQVKELRPEVKISGFQHGIPLRGEQPLCIGFATDIPYVLARHPFAPSWHFASLVARKSFGRIQSVEGSK